ncbi:MAG: choice-of-anchor tandem repeat GloVer-containing protein [Terriglobales bacterium]
MQPSGGLVLGIDGNFYGTAHNGGINHQGMMFKISPSGTFKVLYSFCAQPNCADGASPGAGLVRGNDGNLYGTTVQGGTSNHGTVFKISTTGTLTSLYSFCSQAFCKDGNLPRAALIQAIGGDFYGTTEEGGKYQWGTIFKIDASGTLTTLYSFCAVASCPDGRSPVAGLIQAADGNFYSTTLYGGAHGGGTVFKITPKGTFKTIYNFCSQNRCVDGSSPFAQLVQATDGNLYGTTGGGGNGSDDTGGTVFSVTTGGALTTLYSFCSQTDCTDGEVPQGGVTQGTDGNLYGTTQGGGTIGDGVAFVLSAGLTPFAAALPNSGKAGKTIKILGQGFTSATAVFFNGAPASFTVQSDTYLTATVPAGATTGSISVTTTGGLLTTNKQFRVLE